MKKQNTTKQYYVPNSIQGLFTYTISVLYLVQTGFIAVSTFNQYQEGSDYRPQLGYFVVYNIVPIAIFLLAYVLNPRKLTRLSKSFEALLITVGGYIGWAILNMLVPIAFLSETYFTNPRLYENVSAVVFVMFYAIVLVVLRRKRIWA